MNQIAPPTSAVRAYVASVRAELLDLAPEDVDDLIGGLEADLTERAAELPEGTDLTSAFGAPAAYAAELRSAADLPPRAPVTPDQQSFLAAERARLHDAEVSWRARGDALQARHTWLAELRPVWWVARGMILAIVPTLVLRVPLFGVGFWLFALTGAALSFWWSRRRPAAATWSNRLAILASIVAAVLAFPVALTFMARVGWTDGNGAVSAEPQYYPGPVMGSDGVWVNGEMATNLYAYDANGNRLDRVRLYNQYGQAVAVPTEALIPWSQQGGTIVTGPDGQPLKNPILMKPDGSLDVNRLVFPLRWGDLTGWQASSGGWEPPVKISELPAATAEPARPDASPSPSTSTSTGPQDQTSPSPSPSATS